MTSLPHLTVLVLARLHLWQSSPYDAGFATLAGTTGLTLLVLLARRPRVQRRPLGVLAELLLITTLLSAAIALGHELLTDDLCHGACL